MAELVIRAREVRMQGTTIEEAGMVAIRANRAQNVNRGLPAMVIKDSTPKGRIAIVGYGPSLQQTWERLRDFDTIWTVSKAYTFLVERGIIPTHHMDLDARQHKVDFMTMPQKSTRFFLSTQVMPTYIDKLQAAGCSIELFHCGIDKHERHDPRYPVVKVRFDAGLEACELALQRGYREQHWFGIEYGRAGAETHAGPHNGIKSEHCSVDVDGRMFGSTRLFFHGLMMAEEFLCDRAVVRCTIHGDGLLGHFLKARGRTRFTLKV